MDLFESWHICRIEDLVNVTESVMEGILALIVTRLAVFNELSHEFTGKRGVLELVAARTTSLVKTVNA